MDLAKAKQLLAEAGYPNGFKTEILTHTESAPLDASNFALGPLKEIGIEATIRTMDIVTWYATLRKGDYFISMASDSERLDPDDAYYMRFHSSEIGMNNYSRYSDPGMDRLLEQGRSWVALGGSHAHLSKGRREEHGGSSHPVPCEEHYPHRLPGLREGT